MQVECHQGCNNDVMEERRGDERRGEERGEEGRGWSMKIDRCEMNELWLYERIDECTASTCN